MRPVDLLGGDDQRRHQAHGVVVDGVDDQAAVEARLLKRLRLRVLELERLHEAYPPNAFRSEVAERGLEELAHLRRMADQPVALDDMEHRGRDGTCERIAAACRAVITGLEDVCPLFGPACTDWQPVPPLF